MSQKHLWISLTVFIVLCVVVLSFGSFWTHESVKTWYPTLKRPFWTPPDWVFGPIWSVLYIMIAFAGWLIYSAKDSSERSMALTLYGIQLILNFIWSFLFFSLRSPILGLIDIVLLGVFILLTILKAWSVRPLASLLLIPYLLWVIYATSLNAGIWLLNNEKPFSQTNDSKGLNMKGFVINIENAALDNDNFRKVLYTAKYSQLVLMSLKPGEDIGEEIHQLDQFIRCEAGEGEAILNGIVHKISNGFSVIVPAGAKHNIINTSSQEALKLYTVYSPPNHRDGVIHKTKAAAEGDEEHFDGATTE